MIQPEAAFALLELEPSFNLDEKALQQAYFKQQRATHPDRFVAKPDKERAQAMQQSVDANEAYRLLKSPLSRAQALLKLHNIIVGTEKDSLKPTPTLLMESMQWREDIDEALSVNAAQQLTQNLQHTYAECMTDIENTFAAKQFDEMAAHTLRLGYIIKAQEAAAQKQHYLNKAAS